MTEPSTQPVTPDKLSRTNAEDGDELAGKRPASRGHDPHERPFSRGQDSERPGSRGHNSDRPTSRGHDSERPVSRDPNAWGNLTLGTSPKGTRGADVFNAK